MQPAQPQSWTEAHDVQKVANELINQFHSHLATAEIRYFFFSKEILQGDQQLWGRARKISGLNAVLANPDTTEDKQFFVVEVWKFIWEGMNEKQRRALVDHELEHCWVDENGKLSLLKHDVEEFTNVIKRHGLWRSAVQNFVDAANGKGQADLFDEEKPNTAPEPELAYEGKPGSQNAFPMPTRPDPRQLTAMPANLLGNGSHAMPGTAPRALGSGEPNCPVRCPQCKEHTTHPPAEVNSWANGEVDLECAQCHHKFSFDDVIGIHPTSEAPVPASDYPDAIDAEFVDVEDTAPPGVEDLYPEEAAEQEAAA